MAYDEKLEKRLRAIVGDQNAFCAKKMFGGIGFLLRGNMCFGVYKDDLILRLGVEQAEKALKNKNVKPFDITGRPMRGWVMVTPAGIKTKPHLNRWVKQAVEFVEQLPRK